MANLKSLAKETAIYGISSIFGRFLNYLLVPLYTATMAASSGAYGVITNVYSYTALLLVLLTFGMETTFFRFSTRKEEHDPMQVYANALFFVAGLSGLFLIVGFSFLSPICEVLGYAEHPEYVGMLMFIVALDAVTSISFARLRSEEKAWKFAGIKLFNIGLNIVLNLFFLLLCVVFLALWQVQGLAVCIVWYILLSVLTARKSA